MQQVDAIPTNLLKLEASHFEPRKAPVDFLAGKRITRYLRKSD